MDPGVYEHQYRVEKEHWWFSARMMIIGRVLRHMLGSQPDTRILDVGCGTGAVLEGLSAQYHCSGLDPSEAAVAFCRRRGLKDLYCGTLDSFQGAAGFDVVTFFDVLEHIDDDIRALQRAHALLADGGHLLLTVPAYQFLWGPQDAVLHHKRRYTKSGLLRVVEQAGFVPEYATYFNTLLFPVALIRRLTAKKTNGNPLRDLEIPGKTVNSILKTVFATERFVLPPLRLPFGLSLLCWARKES